MECFVEEACEKWCEEGDEVFDGGWCDVENVCCFVSVEGGHDFLHLLDCDFLDVEASFVSTNVTVPNRKRIALVNETLSRFSNEEKQAIYDYTNQYGQVTYQDGKFKIENDDDLKFVLWGIEQRFYTTLIGGEKRVANSIISI